MIRIRSVKIIKDFKVQLILTNGKKKVVNLEPLLHGQIFEPLRKSPAMFRTIHIDGDSGTLAWANGADMDPDVLIQDLKPAWMEDTANNYSLPALTSHKRAVAEKGTKYNSAKKGRRIN